MLAIVPGIAIPALADPFPSEPPVSIYRVDLAWDIPVSAVAGAGIVVPGAMLAWAGRF